MITGVSHLHTDAAREGKQRQREERRSNDNGADEQAMTIAAVQNWDSCRLSVKQKSQELMWG
jgi:hypothetical protein